MKTYLPLLATYLKPQRRRVVVLAVFILFGSGLQLLGPQLLSRLIDQAHNGADEAALVRLAAAFLGILVVRLLLSPPTAAISAQVSWTATNALREDLALHCLKLDLSFHTARTPGQLIERVDGDISALSNFFSEFTIRILGGVLLIAGALVLLLLRDWRLGLALVAFTILTALIMRRTQGLATPYFKAIRAALATFSGFVEERLTGAEDLRGMGAVPYAVRRIIALQHDLSRKILRGDMLQRVNQSVMEVMIALGYALTFTLGAFLLGRGLITLGLIFLAFDYTYLISRHLSTITNQLDDLASARASLERAAELWRAPNRLVDGAQTLPKDVPLAVTFQNVSFGYAADQSMLHRPMPHRPVLHQVSFELHPGQKLGLIGRTGSGKTTIGRLLSRFYEVTEGVIRLNGVPIHDLQLANVRRRVGIVTQEVQLFHGSVRDNLTFWDEAIRDADLIDALDQLGLHEWLRRLPNGLDTVLGSDGGLSSGLGGGLGSGLSAGEAQLLALGRVFLQDPGLVILDEASARLDPVTERWLDEAMGRLLRGRTAVIIAHRLSTVLNTDTILVLDQGRVIEQGPRAQLQHNPASHFAQLLRASKVVGATGGRPYQSPP